jgi:hypothetical protein
MPNALAHLVFFSWPLVAILIFAAQPPARALAGAVVLGYLLLPEQVALNFPMIPAIDKVMMINLTAATVTAIALRQQRQIAGRGEASPFGRAGWLFGGLIVLTLATPFATVFTNGDPVIAGPRYIPGLRLYDSVSLMMSAAIMIVPFVLGMRVLGTVGAQAELLRVLVIAACAYALLVLFEVRMSPQLSNWIYGFFPHSFEQHMRGGGFRPVVFLPHGLWLGIFLCMAVLGACATWRQSLRDKVASAPWLAAALWLALTLVLSRNLGATALMLVFAPLILFAAPRQQVIVAAALAGMVLVYPMLRGAGLAPTNTVHALAQSVNAERAASLKFRLDQEDTLLDRANERAFAGWGSWGRNRVYDPVTGRDLSVTDGIWVITIGTFGWFGYLAQFGLLTAPLLLLLPRRGHEIAPATAGLAVVMAAALCDLIPNATLTPVTWLAAGALAGLVVRAQQPQTGTVPAPAPAASARAAWVVAGTDGPLSPANASQVNLPAMPGRVGTTHRRQRRT